MTNVLVIQIDVCKVAQAVLIIVEMPPSQFRMLISQTIESLTHCLRFDFQLLLIIGILS
jgi:hypothetical protein